MKSNHAVTRTLSEKTSMNMNRTKTPRLLQLLCATAILVGPAIAQDSHYRPVGQQFPSPECLTMSNAYSAALGGGYRPCPPETYEEWLQDLEHWRTGRRIRIGYDNSRYSNPALQTWNAKDMPSEYSLARDFADVQLSRRTREVHRGDFQD